MLADLARAQQLFDALPVHLQVPTLSPEYVAADARRDSALRPLFLAWQHGPGLLLHAVHEAVVPGREQTDWQSAYGYGGPIVHNLPDALLAEGWRALDEIAHRRRVVAEFVRFHPLIGNHVRYPGAVRADRKVVHIPLAPADLLATYAGRARTAIRKAAAAGLRAQWEPTEDALRCFPEFYREGMRQIGATEFYLFSDAYFQALLGLSSARVLSIVRGSERLSMGLFLFGPVAVEYHLSATVAAGRTLNATNLLIHEAAQAAKEGGREVLYLGGGTSSAIDDPLLRFKDSFATADLYFHTGHRVHDPHAYAQLREAFADLARNSSRVLFYRR